MEHSVSYTVEDGTKYEIRYDNETGDGQQMHYLVFENDVLKLETSHHALPGGLTEDQFKSTVVVGSFFNCLQRTFAEQQDRLVMENAGSKALADLAALVELHMPLRPEQLEWVGTVISRGHSVELLVQVIRDGKVERFARQLNADVVDGQIVDIRDDVAPSRLPAWVLPTLWSVGVVAVTVLAVFGGKLFGLE